MKEKKAKPNENKKGINEQKIKETVRKTEQLKFSFLEVVILLLITSLVTIVTTNTLSKKGVVENKINYNVDINDFINEYNFILNKYYGEINSKDLIKNAIAGMVNGLKDPYSVFINEENATNFDVELEGEFYGLGVEIIVNDKSQIEVYRVLDGYNAKTAGILKGDIITHMDGESIEGLDTAKFRSKMIENNKQTVTLTILRDGKSMDVVIKRALVTIDSVKKGIFESGSAKVGYIGISIFANNTYKQFKSALDDLEKENVDSLIIDVRSNSGGHLAVVTDIISEFVDSNHVIYQIKDANNTIKQYSTGKRNLNYPIIVLIDSASASASELLASALKEQANAKLLGNKSFGKSTVQQVVDMPNGAKYKITIKEWLTSLGNVINGVGIMPDVEINLSEEYFKNPSNETDNQLNEAIKLLKKK